MSIIRNWRSSRRQKEREKKRWKNGGRTYGGVKKGGGEEVGMIVFTKRWRKQERRMSEEYQSEYIMTTEIQKATEDDDRLIIELKSTDE